MDAATSATQMNTPSFGPQILPDRAVISVAGTDSLSFLHNLLTMDLSVAKPAYGALLTPQGKILHDVFVLPDKDVVWVDVAAGQAAELLKRLLMYKLRAKLDINLHGDKQVAVSSEGMMGLTYADPRLASMGWRGIVAAGDLSEGAGYHAARIFHGLGDSMADIGSGDLFVHEANLDQFRGVSFSKGCYVGQEVVSRTHHRHTTRNRILPVEISQAVAHGTEITSGETRLGTMLSSQGSRGLALLRLDRLAGVSAPLTAAAARIVPRKPAWAAFELTLPEVAS